MCGICGISGDKNITLEQLTRMTNAIIHRGPDDDGYYLSKSVGFGMRRLSIIDLDTGKQPIHNEDSSIQVVFNGEIYNYLELRSLLIKKGHTFYTDSDTEVIVHSYEEYGENCFSLFRGMFAIAILDARFDRLILSIDRFGIKPLYYSNEGNQLVFGSELKCLLSSGICSKSIDYDALAQYFTYGYIPAPLSIYRQIYKLLPGHYLVWNKSKEFSINSYWDYQQKLQLSTHSLEQTREELLVKLKDAIKSHLISDVPIGAFLSGGIDSSTVVALMSQVTEKPVKTFSIGFRDKEYNELDNARIIAQKFHTDHHELIIEPESMEILPKIISYFGEPFADSSSIPTYYVSKMAREYVKVALSGDGGDELFLGYTIFQGLEFTRMINKCPYPLRKAILTMGEKATNMVFYNKKDKKNKWHKRFSDSLLPVNEAYFNKITVGGLDAIFPVLSKDLQNELIDKNPNTIVTNYLVNGRRNSQKSHPLEPFAYTGIKMSLPGQMLVKVDRMSMANSLEIRVPLLDHLLADFVSTIPISNRFSNWRLKSLLKDTLSGIIPQSILRQPKKGFVPPMASWFRGDLNVFIKDNLISSANLQKGCFNKVELSKIIDNHFTGINNNSSVIWSLLIFSIWEQSYSSEN
jgi:asparagine synthase (glutamine-hydrolysing)